MHVRSRPPHQGAAHRGAAGGAALFQKDIASGEWSGSCIDMAKDIAKVFDAKLEYVESTYGNSVLDLQSNKVDLAFALNPTPARALSIGFTQPMIVHPFGCVARKGFDPKTWDDLNKPEMRMVYDIGSLHETRRSAIAPRRSSPATRRATNASWRCSPAAPMWTSSRPCSGCPRSARTRAGHLPSVERPLVALPSCLGIQREPDTRFVEVVNAWIDFNRGTGHIREWLMDGMAKSGVTRDRFRRADVLICGGADALSMGLRLPAALCAAVLSGRAGHAGLYGGHDLARPAAGPADRAGRLSRSRMVNVPLVALIEVFRCTPLLVQIVWFYYALPVMMNVQIPATVAATTVLSCYTARSTPRFSVAASSPSSAGSGTRRARSACSAGP